MEASELKGAELDLWVARAAELQIVEMCGYYLICEFCKKRNGQEVIGYVLGENPRLTDNDSMYAKFSPSTNWAHGGPLIDGLGLYSECMKVQGENGDVWAVKVLKRIDSIPPFMEIYGYGETMLVAAMRAIVTLKFGEELPEVVK